MEVLEAEPGRVVRHTFQERAEWFRVEIEVHEDERRPRLHLHRDQRELVIAERAEAFP